mmetsp:Transcript_47525/g.34800  ORF Transcript_47525/g.34800 Transcript_47525/m.34800 type:complete len:290 (-) Transcript_47525:57-926(-)|eukprot:CAMPEP_0202956800 /NCGR_PEP_ID=MMETSP1396-20130829/1302_1 /ASSEMBLY_ACC=CAM_ASM_000872 /TAXON_ID= /ORGANISM="Pseudokeronopsis sp., Strain Brazil" /LENGTH=289 /DNA_ID=CAMNT_0049673989 /DNA_START=232 /DNA_END=1101 /DNA_ORIENTATION=-
MECNAEILLDQVYQAKKKAINSFRSRYSILDNDMPNIPYDDLDQDTYRACIKGLVPIWRESAANEFNDSLSELSKEVNFQREIPQFRVMSQFINSKTGWRMAPALGILDHRYFINALAFRVLHSTMYLRHHSNPNYSPEPDYIHEAIGHGLHLAHPELNEIYQIIGLASLGATEEELEKLSLLYMHTAEFGMINQDNKRKIYGAAILTSIEEMQHAAHSKKIDYIRLDPHLIVNNYKEIVLTKVQGTYFYVDSIEEARARVSEYCEHLRPGLKLRYNVLKQSIEGSSSD